MSERPRRRRSDAPSPLGLLALRYTRPRDLVGLVAILLFFVALVLGAALAAPLHWFFSLFG
jgi:hypothetical protein